MSSSRVSEGEVGIWGISHPHQLPPASHLGLQRGHLMMPGLAEYDHCRSRHLMPGLNVRFGPLIGIT